jgi:hypothetical protein
MLREREREKEREKERDGTIFTTFRVSRVTDRVIEYLSLSTSVSLRFFCSRKMVGDDDEVSGAWETYQKALRRTGRCSLQQAACRK